MSKTIPARHTVANLLAFVLKRDGAHTTAETVYTYDDFDAAVREALPLAHLDGRPFHMAADLLGVSPALLSGILERGAESEHECANSGADPLERDCLTANAEALLTASRMYEAENAPPAPVPGPDMRNDALADLLDEIKKTATGAEYDALDEAAQRIRERGDEEEG